MHHTGKKENKKEKEKKRSRKIYIKAIQTRTLSNRLGPKMNACIHWTNSISADNSSVKEVYIASLSDWQFSRMTFFCFRVELNL